MGEGSLSLFEQTAEQGPERSWGASDRDVGEDGSR